VILGLWCGFQGQYSTHAQGVIAVPGTVGNTESNLPFSYNTPISLRCQQVYNASAFSSASQGCRITALAFNIWSRNVLASSQDAQIDFSTTSRSENGLSTTFADNVGSDDTVVFARGLLTIDPEGPGAPPGFSVLIQLTNPFIYRPANGNLLMDVRIFQGATGAGGPPGDLDASDGLADGTSRVYAFSVGSTAGTADTIGLVTGFVVTPVPEPGTGVLLLVGLLVVLLLRSTCRA